MDLTAVPAGWNKFTLGELFEFSNGVNADKSAYGAGIPFINVLDVIENEALTEAAIPGRIKLSPSLAARYQVRYGDVLLNRTSETQDEVALASVYLGDFPVVFGGFVFRARPKTNNLDAGYSKYVLRVSRVREQIVARGQGGIRANIGQRDLKTVHVSLPPIDEQRTIAATLSEVDELIAALERMIIKKRALKQGMMQQLLTGKTRLPGFAKSWSSTTLGALASISRGASPRPIASSRWFDSKSDVRWVRIADVNRSDGRTLRVTTQALSPDGIARSRFLKAGSLIMSIAATVGIPVITGVPTCIHDGFVALENLKADQRFLLYLLKASEATLREAGQSGSQMNVNTDIVRGLVVRIPDDRNEQERIAEALWDLDDQISTLERRIVKNRAIKQGMLQQLLTGRTRLPAKESAA